MWKNVIILLWLLFKSFIINAVFSNDYYVIVFVINRNGIAASNTSSDRHCGTDASPVIVIGSAFYAPEEGKIHFNDNVN